MKKLLRYLREGCRIFIMFSLLAIVAVGCSPTRKKAQQIQTSDEQVILVNDITSSRKKLGELVDLISACKPKVIGINALFVDVKDPVGDSILANAFERAGNIILPANFGADNNLITSHPYFQDKCLSYGVVDFRHNDVFKAYHPHTSFGWSFPVATVVHFDPAIGKEIKDKTKPLTEYSISFEGNKKEFQMILNPFEEDSICDRVRDKIVLIGYLGPAKEDLVVTPWDDVVEGTYSTIVLSKMISNLLNDTY